ncbi:TetR/AcrR family transcriptional regulator [Streptomyces xanthochromogenes]|uniref:TetR/AcrR family transcriptional regulator n=1 Tax=Streptomyces xanthochromogenes TaxID=67384 RepID=UPI003824ABDB
MAEADGAGTPRERYRAQVRAEIKQHAWEQIGTAGASGLSLNAIAKQMGLSGPALYRYFSGRDELITELVRDAYRSLADTLHAVAAESGSASPGAEPSASGKAAGAESSVSGKAAGVEQSATGKAAVPGTSRTADLAELAHALRGWALEDPNRYFLVYGTPVPGYHAPDDTTLIADEIMRMLLDACMALPPRREPAPFATHIVEHRQWAEGHPAPPAALHKALTFWTRLHGVLSLEAAGHFSGMGFDPARLFDAELDDLLDG